MNWNKDGGPSKSLTVSACAIWHYLFNHPVNADDCFAFAIASFIHRYLGFLPTHAQCGWNDPLFLSWVLSYHKLTLHTYLQLSHIQFSGLAFRFNPTIAWANTQKSKVFLDKYWQCSKFKHVLHFWPSSTNQAISGRTLMTTRVAIDSNYPNRLMVNFMSMLENMILPFAK